MKHFLIALSFLAFFSSCTDTKPTEEVISKPVKEDHSAPAITYSLVGTTPHDTLAFTEGLLFYNDQLFESTGAPDYMPQARSLFGIVDMKTGKIDVKAELDKKIYFGEGIVILNGKIFQLTYKNQLGFIYDAKTYKKIGEFSYANKEGWGMTTDGTNIIMSDGSNVLFYLDPNTQKVIKTLQVNDDGFAEDYLNELEFINGYIYANIWNKNFIVKIDPATGKVLGRMDLTMLCNTARAKFRNGLEMNGIAYDAKNDKVYITGKFWPDLYQINFPH
jgi:glutamine cyclotransferase